MGMHSGAVSRSVLAGKQTIATLSHVMARPSRNGLEGSVAMGDVWFWLATAGMEYRALRWSAQQRPAPEGQERKGTSRRASVGTAPERNGGIEMRRIVWQRSGRPG